MPRPDNDAFLEELLRHVRRTSRSRATAADIASAESELGLRLPPLLRRIYLEVADGGFGPGYGLLPLRRGRPEHGQERSVVETYAMFTEGRGWPPVLVPICDWGCAI